MGQCNYRFAVQQVPDLSLNSSFLEVLEKINNNVRLNNLMNLLEGEIEDGISVVRKNLEDCFYCNSKRKLDFPMELFQAPFYSHGLPRSLNYGGFGVTFAHQLLHDFHTEGKCRYYGGTPCDLFDSCSFTECNKRAECFYDLYWKTTEKVINATNTTKFRDHPRVPTLIRS
ncbi:endothelin-converting enzyme homolog [Amblyomma americanum]